jgi:hypothetical protein
MTSSFSYAKEFFRVKACLESYLRKNPREDYQVVAVTTYINPISALIEFKPYYYDLLLVDSNIEVTVAR